MQHLRNILSVLDKDPIQLRANVVCSNLTFNYLKFLRGEQICTKFKFSERLANKILDLEPKDEYSESTEYCAISRAIEIRDYCKLKNFNVDNLTKDYATLALLNKNYKFIDLCGVYAIRNVMISPTYEEILDFCGLIVLETPEVEEIMDTVEDAHNISKSITNLLKFLESDICVKHPTAVLRHHATAVLRRYEWCKFLVNNGRCYISKSWWEFIKNIVQL